MTELVFCFFTVISKLLFVYLVALAFKGALWAFNLFVLAPLSDPLRQLPGPRAGYWENHFWELMEYASDPSLRLTTLTKVSTPAQTSLLKPTMSGQGSTAKPGDSTGSAL